jgi:tetratricopeptide (TPR) repeat protein
MAAYDAFVSYSHAKDKPIAAALQSVIQRLGKPWYRRRALRIFRDDTSLSATPSLWPSIEQALGNSRFLVLLASPEAAASHWVNKEVSWWLDNKSADTLLIALTDSELSWDNATGDFAAREGMPLPPALSGRFTNEPKWIDLRAYRDGADARDARFIEAGADFAAAIHGLPKEDLLSQEVRQQRRALRLAWSAAGTLAILIAVAGWQWWEATSQRNRAEENFDIAAEAADFVVVQIARDLRNVQGMRIESVGRILDTARVMIDTLARAAPDNLQPQASRNGMLYEVTDTYLRAGDLVRARAAAEENLALTRKLAAANPGNVEWQRGVSLSLNRIGVVLQTEGDRASATKAFEESIAIGRKLAATGPGNLERQRDLSISLILYGAVWLPAADYKKALDAFEESLALRRSVAGTNPENTQWQSDVAVVLDRIGEVRMAAGDKSGAANAFIEAADIIRKLANSDPGNAGWQRQLSVALSRAGDVLTEARRVQGLFAYQDSLAIMRKLASVDQGDVELQRQLAALLLKVGDARLAMDDHTGALDVYQESLVIMRRLMSVDMTNLLWWYDLGISYERIGFARRAAGDRGGALSAFEDGLIAQRTSVAGDPKNVQWQTSLASILYHIGTVSDPPRARTALREALAIVEPIARDGRLSAAQETWPQMIREALAQLPPEAVGAQ